LRTPVPEDPNPHIVFQSDLTSRLLPVPTGHSSDSTPHSHEVISLDSSTPSVHHAAAPRPRSQFPMATPHLLSSPYKHSRRPPLQASKLQTGGEAGPRAVVPVEAVKDDAPPSLWTASWRLGDGHREADLEAHSAGARQLCISATT
jgi:hypothetical protein